MRHLLEGSAVESEPAMTSSEIPSACPTLATASAFATWWAPINLKPTVVRPAGVTKSKCGRPSRISTSVARTSQS